MNGSTMVRLRCTLCPCHHVSLCYGRDSKSEDDASLFWCGERGTLGTVEHPTSGVLSFETDGIQGVLRIMSVSIRTYFWSERLQLRDHLLSLVPPL